MSGAAVIALEPDHANITQISDWMHSAGRWNDLADFLLHTGVKSTRNTARTRALLRECRTHIDDLSATGQWLAMRTEFEGRGWLD